MLDAYRDLIDELLGTPAAIRNAVTGAESTSPEALDAIAALRDRDRAVLERLQTVTRREMPFLPELRIDPAPAEQNLASLLEEMETARGDLVSLLMNLTLKDWERQAIHETAGEITLADEVEQHVEYDEAQRQRILDLRPA